MARGKRLKSAAEKLAFGFDIPRELVTDAAKITMVGVKEIRIERHKGLAEYGSERIVVRCGSFDAMITGNNLTLEVMDDYELCIIGTIHGVQNVM